MQRTGLEWVYRMLQEPRRLAGRYLDNIAFLVRAVFAPRFRRERRRANSLTSPARTADTT
jgi:UDP-N-acetyl-D-mannosaminuronic acid transferase (WecB/TagA/CpsF family)